MNFIGERERAILSNHERSIIPMGLPGREAISWAWSEVKVGPQIGRGAFGTVHLGTHVRTGQHVAVKLQEVGIVTNLLKHEVRPSRIGSRSVCQRE